MSDTPGDTPPPGWEGLLAQGERILWQGRPVPGVIWREIWHVQLFMGVFFCVFSALWTRGVYWMGGRMPEGMGGGLLTIFPVFGALFFGVGLYMIAGRLFWDAFVRGRTWYTLTNQAAYVATDLFGKRRLVRHEFDAMQDPSLTDTQPGDVIFGQERRHYTSRSRWGAEGEFSRRRTHTYYVPIGFRRIEDARAVYRVLVDQRARRTNRD